MSTPVGNVWFRAKKYGWGWGLPCTWQGWVVYAAYLLLIAAGIAWFSIPERTVSFVSYALLVTAALVATCWVKGEKPRWRWGS